MSRLVTSPTRKRVTGCCGKFWHSTFQYHICMIFLKIANWIIRLFKRYSRCPAYPFKTCLCGSWCANVQEQDLCFLGTHVGSIEATTSRNSGFVGFLKTQLNKLWHRNRRFREAFRWSSNELSFDNRRREKLWNFPSLDGMFGLGHSRKHATPPRPFSGATPPPPLQPFAWFVCTSEYTSRIIEPLDSPLLFYVAVHLSYNLCLIWPCPLPKSLKMYLLASTYINCMKKNIPVKKCLRKHASLRWQYLWCGSYKCCHKKFFWEFFSEISEHFSCISQAIMSQSLWSQLIIGKIFSSCRTWV